MRETHERVAARLSLFVASYDATVETALCMHPTTSPCCNLSAGRTLVIQLRGLPAQLLEPGCVCIVAGIWTRQTREKHTGASH